MGMPLLTLNGGGLIEALGANTANSAGTALVSNTIAQLVASTSFPYNAIQVSIMVAPTGTATDSSLDILIGSSGNEYTLIDKLRNIRDNTGDNDVENRWILPLYVPQGVRLAARNNGVAATSIIVHGMNGGVLGNAGFNRAESMGLTGNLGTIIDPGAAANTLGAWTEITPSTAHAYGALMMVFGGDAATSGANSWLIDIGVGTAGNEYALVKQCYGRGAASASAPMPNTYGPFPCNIPAGTRLAVRCQSSSATSASRKIDVALYGFIQ